MYLPSVLLAMLVQINMCSSEAVVSALRNGTARSSVLPVNHLPAGELEFAGKYSNERGHIRPKTLLSADWTQTSALSADWDSIASDRTGRYLAACSIGGIYTSSDYGVTWIQSSAPSASWTSITSDSTGQYLAAVVGWGGRIYTSSNYGATWTQTSAP
ncbi:hypothetical protein B484DRAFT_439722, partial [Ochromonadaceae sp. CCMP2298]